MVSGVVLCAVSKSASHTLHDLFIVDVGVVCHYMRAGVVIVHLAVYEVVSSSHDSDKTSVVFNGAHLVTDDPVCYHMTNC